MIIYMYYMSSELIRKRDSSGKESSAIVYVSVEGRSHINSEKTKYFFDLAHSKSKSNSWRINIHLEYFPPNNCQVRICCMGLQLEMVVVLCNKM
jgi:hypothetical protein